MRSAVFALLAARDLVGVRAWQTAASIRAYQRAARPLLTHQFALEALRPFSRTMCTQLAASQRSGPRNRDVFCTPDNHTGVEPGARLSVTQPTDHDIDVLERQLGHKLSGVWAVSSHCDHGYPQAFVWDPLRRHSSGKARKMLLDSGLIRLSCPLLVQAIDAWEGEGAVNTLNAEVRADDSLLAHLTHAHRGHANARREVVGERVDELLASTTDEFVETTRMVLRSGIAGQSPNKNDVKCLHAQVADALCRPGQNQIGELILERLQQRGVEVRGCTTCSQQCNPEVPADEAKFWYTPEKNRWKLRKKLMRRQAQRSHDVGLSPAQRG